MTETTWGAYYHEIASQMRLYRESNRRLAELADLRPGMTVVDLGAGSGLTAQALLEQAEGPLRLILIDSSPSMIRRAKDLLGDRADEYHAAPAERAAELVSEPVDRVICNMSLWYFKEPETVLAQVRRMLKPTGRFIFNLSGTYFNTGGGVVSPQWALLRLLHERGCPVKPIPEVERLPNQRSIEATLTRSGYKLLKYELQEIEAPAPETEPGGELWNLLRLFPVLPGETAAEAAERSVALLPELAEALAAYKPRWRTANFVAMPALSPEELLMQKFGGKLPR